MTDNKPFDQIVWNTNDRRTVRITLTAKHTVPDQRNRCVVSLFPGSKQEWRSGSEDHANPEDYPEEMNDALQDMLDRDAGCTEGEIYDNAAGVGEDEETPDGLEELWERLQEISQQCEDDEDDVYVFRTLGSMERKITDDGREVVEISYTEEESMDDTGTLIQYDPKKPGYVAIYHTGGVFSTLICEKGVRHISTYRTPIMNFEIAVYTKKCEGGFTFDEGGSLELDYMVEVRGADMQRTVMTIDAIVL